MSDSSSGLRTPLGKVRFLGAAKTGTTEAWLIHVTAVALVPLSLYFVWLMLDLVQMDYNGVRASLSRPVPAILLLAFTLAGLLHMELGMRSVIVDYIHGHGRAWALVVNTCFCALMAFACVYALLRIAFT
jgi:succinate dehydrogenase / fumarate reductase membrane anchor subunit